MGLGAVLDDRHPGLSRQLQETVQVTARAVEVHQHHRAGPRRDRGAGGVGRHAQGGGVDVDQDRDGAERRHRRGAGDPRDPRHQHLVAAGDPERLQGDREGRRAAGAGDAERNVVVAGIGSREPALERLLPPVHTADRPAPRMESATDQLLGSFVRPRPGRPTTGPERLSACHRQSFHVSAPPSLTAVVDRGRSSTMDASHGRRRFRSGRAVRRERGLCRKRVTTACGKSALYAEAVESQSSQDLMHRIRRNGRAASLTL